MCDPDNIGPTCWNCERVLIDSEIEDSPHECFYCGAEFEVSDEPIAEDMKVYLGINGDTLWYGDARRTNAERAAYLRGIAAGFAAFAWWKDGIQFVGSCGTRLQTAMKTVSNEVNRIRNMIIAPPVEMGDSDGSES